MLGRNESQHHIPGPAGRLEAVVTEVESDSPECFAVIGHPHPLMGGTMQNKVVHTVARALRDLGIPSIRFNFRGTGKSEGSYDEGRGETDDFLAAVAWGREQWPEAKLICAGFSFGSYVAANAARQLQEQGEAVDRLILIAPPVERMAFAEMAPFPMPTLVIQGEEDDVVAPETVYEWIDHRQPTVHLERVAGTGHFFHGCLPELKGLIQQYLKN